MQRLQPEALARRCDPASLPLESTHDHKPGELTALLGQERAAGAIDHALAVRRDGYHLFVMGPRGIGKTRFVREAIHRHGARSERGDWVYVNHFERPERPLALGLPAGVGTQLRDDMRHLVDELKAMIPAAFEAESYAAEVERIQSDIGERHGKALSALNEEANQDGIALVQTPNGFSLAPMADGEVMPPDAFAKLPE
ncbi:MAG: Lon-like protease helical domain-containing protein, partial [Burkholderiaceae bacterium]